MFFSSKFTDAKVEQLLLGTNFALFDSINSRRSRAKPRKKEKRKKKEESSRGDSASASNSNNSMAELISPLQLRSKGRQENSGEGIKEEMRYVER